MYSTGARAYRRARLQARASKGVRARSHPRAVTTGASGCAQAPEMSAVSRKELELLVEERW